MSFATVKARQTITQDYPDEAGKNWQNLLHCPKCFGKIECLAGRWRCVACEREYPSAGQAPDFLSGNAGAEEIEDDYEKDPRRGGGTLRRFCHDFLRTFEVGVIASEVERLGRALDIVDIGASDPTGVGTYHDRIKPLARTYLGVEPSLPLVRSAVPTSTVGVVRGSGEQDLLRPGVIDVAICFAALDHCLDPGLVLSNMAKALRDGGCALIDLKNVDAWYRPMYDHAPRWLQRRVAPCEHAHPWNFSPKFLASRLRAASFRTVEIHDFFYVAAFLRTKYLDWMPPLLGAERCQRWLRRAEAIGQGLAPGRGGTLVALARK